MAKSKYLTAPIPSEKTPVGIPYILFNEMGERFSFYGMRCILVIFMTKYLMGPGGVLDAMSAGESKTYFHLFVSAVYFTPIIGALLSDIWLGKYRTILYFSMLYCAGFFVLSADNTRLGLGVGLILIAVGSGVIKPCVSANVGDQFGKTNKHLMAKVYGWFYFSINVGAFVSTILCPILLDKYSPRVAFGVPCIFMVLATFAFWLGRRKYVHIPRGGMEFVKETLSGEGIKAIARLCIIYVFVAMFWALFDQMDSAWVLQAEKMNRYWLGHEWLSSQIVAVNPLMIMVLIPVFSYIIYRAIDRVFPLTALRKISIGLFVAILSFVVPGWVETQINGGDVFKCSSRSTVEGLEPVRLLDGATDGTGWSSNKAPSVNEPIEVVIRLRERRSWNVSAIEIDPSTTLSDEEIIATLNNLAFDTLKQFKELRDSGKLSQDDMEVLTKKAGVLKAAAREAREAANKARKAAGGTARSREAKLKAKRAAAAEVARSVAVKALNEVGESTSVLQDERYYPREISVFAADFSGRLLPKLIFELEDEEKQEIDEPVEFARKKGWTHVGNFLLAEDGAAKRFEFAPLSATHILVQVKSNYGADRVKIGEIRVLTTDSIPPQTKATIAEVWPNVAAIGYKPSVGWLILAHVIIAAAEVMVSITCLEFSYTQAPKKMKSFIMAVFLLSISLGNAFTALVNIFIQNEDGSSKLAGPSYFWFFAMMMLVTAVLFIPVARRYRVKTYIQDETSEESTA